MAAGLTLFVAVGSLYSETISGYYTQGLWGLFDVALLLALCYGIHRKSRFCSVALLVYHVGGQILVAIESGRSPGALVVLTFGFFYLRGAAGTFKWRRLAMEQGRIARPRSGVKTYLGFGASGLFLAAFIAFLYWGMNTPPTHVVPGRQLNTRYLDRMKELNVLEDGEEVLYWYSDALSDISEGFYFYTESGVTVYSESYETPIISVRYEEIADMILLGSTNLLEDSQVLLTLNDGSDLVFPVSAEGAGDERFFDLMHKAWREKVKYRTPCLSQNRKYPPNPL